MHKPVAPMAQRHVNITGLSPSAKKRHATIATLCFPDVAEQRKTRQDREHTLGVPGRQRQLLNPATRLVAFCRLRAAAAVASRFRCVWSSASCGDRKSVV